MPFIAKPYRWFAALFQLKIHTGATGTHTKLRYNGRFSLTLACSHSFQSNLSSVHACTLTHNPGPWYWVSTCAQKQLQAFKTLCPHKRNYRDADTHTHVQTHTHALCRQGTKERPHGLFVQQSCVPYAHLSFWYYHSSVILSFCPSVWKAERERG